MLADGFCLDYTVWVVIHVETFVKKVWATGDLER